MIGKHPCDVGVVLAAPVSQPCAETADVVAALDMERVKLAAAEPPSTASTSDRIVIQQAVSTAFVTAFRYMTLTAAGLAVASALTAATMIGGHRCPAEGP